MENKKKGLNIFKVIGNILYAILVVFIIIILAVVVIQRFSHNKASIGGIRIFNIVTESMVPEYKVGDILVAKEIEPNKIKVGDDIVYLGDDGSFYGKVVTHRVIQIDQEDGKLLFHTKGIANNTEDPIVKENQVFGKIVYKTVVLSFIGKIMNNLYGFYFLIFMPLGILLIVKIIRVWNERHEDEDEDEDEDDEDEHDKDDKEDNDEEIDNKKEEKIEKKDDK